ncbi:hypothetical protein MNBD_GAMMA21-2799 [hydrothermal vent metagenome]|uniref:Uncharacterized protein n=1 Tax=hydrothermal vent metagenome TaxID=652676 RepID=A0A3B0ZUT2_9ZZZZ
MSNAKVVLIVLVTLSFIMGGYESILYSEGLEISWSLNYIWVFVFFILVALWVGEDSKSYPAIYRPYEFGFLFFNSSIFLTICLKQETS